MSSSVSTMPADSTQADDKVKKAKKRKKQTQDKKSKKAKKAVSARKAKTRRGSSDDSCSDHDSDLDLDKPLLAIRGYIKDRQEMLNQLFRSISRKKLRAMLPEILKALTVDDLKSMCLEHLEVMSKKRIIRLLEGVENDNISSSSSEEDSITDDPHIDDVGAEAGAGSGDEEKGTGDGQEEVSIATDSPHSSDGEGEGHDEDMASPDLSLEPDQDEVDSLCGDRSHHSESDGTSYEHHSEDEEGDAVVEDAGEEEDDNKSETKAEEECLVSQTDVEEKEKVYVEGGSEDGEIRSERSESEEEEEGEQFDVSDKEKIDSACTEEVADLDGTNQEEALEKIEMHNLEQAQTVEDIVDDSKEKTARRDEITKDSTDKIDSDKETVIEHQEFHHEDIISQSKIQEEDAQDYRDAEKEMTKEQDEGFENKEEEFKQAEKRIIQREDESHIKAAPQKGPGAKAEVQKISPTAVLTRRVIVTQKENLVEVVEMPKPEGASTRLVVLKHPADAAAKEKPEATQRIEAPRRIIKLGSLPQEKPLAALSKERSIVASASKEQVIASKNVSTHDTSIRRHSSIITSAQASHDHRARSKSAQDLPTSATTGVKQKSLYSNTQMAAEAGLHGKASVLNKTLMQVKSVTTTPPLVASASDHSKGKLATTFAAKSKEDIVQSAVTSKRFQKESTEKLPSKIVTAEHSKEKLSRSGPPDPKPPSSKEAGQKKSVLLTKKITAPTVSAVKTPDIQNRTDKSAGKPAAKTPVLHTDQSAKPSATPTAKPTASVTKSTSSSPGTSAPAAATSTSGAASASISSILSTNQMEILELEMRARAIKAMLKAKTYKPK